MALYDGPEPPGLGGRREAGGPFRPTGADDVARLFRERHAELVRLAALVVGDRATAEDVVQDVFARLCARNLLPDRDHALVYVRAAVLNGSPPPPGGEDLPLPADQSRPGQRFLRGARRGARRDRLVG
jgi:hypothetical protein